MNTLLNKLSMHRGSRAAFTLIELLVVVAIIILLVSLLWPNARGAQDRARVAACVANQRGIAAGTFVYASDHQGALPLDTGPQNPWRTYLVAAGGAVYVTNSPNGMGLVYARGYVREARAFYCPARDRDPEATDNILRLYWGRIGSGPMDWRTGSGNRARAGYYLNFYRFASVGNPTSAVSTIIQTPGEPLPPEKRVLTLDVFRNWAANSGRNLVFHDNVVVMSKLDGSARAYDKTRAQARYETDSRGASIDGDYPLADLVVMDLLGLTP